MCSPEIESQTHHPPTLAEVDPRLIEILSDVGNEWGALGVALVAAQMTDSDALLARLEAPRG